VGRRRAHHVTTGDPEAVLAASASNWISLFAIFALTALYSTTGGLRSVVATDVVQFAIAMGATALYAAVLVGEAGGLAALPGRGSPSSTAPTMSPGRCWPSPRPGAEAGGVALVVIAVQWIAQMNADGTGYLAQRAMACRSEARRAPGALVFAVAQVVLRSLLWIPIGLSLLVLFPAAGGDGRGGGGRREATFVEGIAAPAGGRARADADRHAGGAGLDPRHAPELGRVVLDPRRLRARLVPRRARPRAGPAAPRLGGAGSTVGILIVALAVLTRIESIQTAWQATLLLGAGMGVPLLLRWCGGG
jgi:solute:Na+ symporter, SSS family